MIGIYKITSPKGAIYVGKSKNIENRFKNYKYVNNDNGQTKLYRSLKKYGVEFHQFEIIEECVEEILNERETYWIDKYKCYHHLNKKLGLNLTKGGEGGNGILRTKQMKDNHSKKTTGKVRNEQSKNNVSKALINKPKPEGFSERLSKLSNKIPIGKKYTEKDPNHYLTGKTRPQWVKDKIRVGMENNKKSKSKETINKMRTNNPWNIITNQYDLEGNFIKEWPSQAEAARFYNIDSTGIYNCCKGKQKTAGGFIWKYKEK